MSSAEVESTPAVEVTETMDTTEEAKTAATKEEESSAEGKKETTEHDEAKENGVDEEGHKEEKSQDGDEKKSETEEGHSSKVAEHYNKIEEKGKDHRKQSKIYFMRNFNNWAKSQIIADALNRITKTTRSRSVAVLDLACGKGGDLYKWRAGEIGTLVCADIAATSVDQCKDRFRDMRDRSGRDFCHGEFIVLDATKDRLRNKLKKKEMQFDLTSCQFAFHYSFESAKQADMMMRNATENLKPGGYFLLTIPDDNDLVSRWKQSEKDSFGNEIYEVKFSQGVYDAQNLPPLFGAQYHFKLEGVVDCPEFLVNQTVLEKLAARYKMNLIYKKRFREVFDQNKITDEGKRLLTKMQALETYPPEHGDEASSEDFRTEFPHAVSMLAFLEENVDDQGRRPFRVGCLSTSHWQAVSLYTAFLFQKEPPPPPPEEEKKEEEKATEESESKTEKSESKGESDKKSDEAAKEEPSEDAEMKEPEKETTDEKKDEEATE
ncbi:unnamed protein product [Cyprideis torosa]|uniref:mRNA cap guanine-N(7) methyltransferase n=1 Tax=Cyprideis torosa TaxID=163714 RepID=A0A7R8W9K7_9CRUS|nr:unnamed protein product [Cyprideis torosa]CAG0887438.1 unnamed protein product [Cyprideis torosa]